MKILAVYLSWEHQMNNDHLPHLANEDYESCLLHC